MGIAKDAIADYWKRRGDRYAREGHWGLGAYTEEEHEAQVAARAAFIFEEHPKAGRGCPRDLRTLDYGCGIGMYTPFFANGQAEGPQTNGNYIGMDISEAHIRLARKRNPGAYYHEITTPTWDMTEQEFTWAFDVFFTATVLQHCSDETVNGLFENVARRRPGRFSFSLYEYANANWTNAQTIGRGHEEYIAMLGQWFAVKDYSARRHVIDGGEYAHIMVDVEGA